jgi:hypothetical protein
VVVNLGHRPSSLFGEQLLSAPIHSPLSGRLIGPSGTRGLEMRGQWGGDAEAAQVPRCGMRALERSVTVVAWQSSILFLLALFDCRFLQILELKCTKVQIEKL